MTAGSSGARTLGTVYTLLSAAAWSLAGLLQRQLHMSVATQLAGRAVFAFAALLVFVAVAERGRVIRALHATGRAGLLVTVLMAVSSISFLTALNDAPVADVMVIQALAPLAAALLGLLAGEPVRPRTWAATGVAVAGFAVMAGAPSRPPLAGTAFSLLAMLGYAAMIVVSRRKSEVSMAPATCASQVLVFALFAPAARVSQLGGSGLGYLALMGIVQMGLGLLFISLGARLIPAVEVALIAQLENVLAPLWVWLAGFERPSPATVVGGLVVLAAVAVQVTAPGPGGADLGLESWRDDRQDPLAGFERGWRRRRRHRPRGLRRKRAAGPDGEPG